jgi:hypothetical protein
MTCRVLDRGNHRPFCKEFYFIIELGDGGVGRYVWLFGVIIADAYADFQLGYPQSINYNQSNPHRLEYNPIITSKLRSGGIHCMT